MLICGILTLKDWREKDVSSQHCDKNIVTSNRLMQNRNCILIYFKIEAWTHKGFEATKIHVMLKTFISQNVTKTSG